MLRHVVTQGSHHLLVEPNHSGMAFKLLDVPIVVTSRSTSI